MLFEPSPLASPRHNNKILKNYIKFKSSAENDFLYYTLKSRVQYM
jgi:hypothetical protein